MNKKGVGLTLIIIILICGVLLYQGCNECTNPLKPFPPSEQSVYTCAEIGVEPGKVYGVQKKPNGTLLSTTFGYLGKHNGDIFRQYFDVQIRCSSINIFNDWSDKTLNLTYFSFQLDGDCTSISIYAVDPTFNWLNWSSFTSGQFLGYTKCNQAISGNIAIPLNSAFVYTSGSYVYMRFAAVSSDEVNETSASIRKNRYPCGYSRYSIITQDKGTLNITTTPVQGYIYINGEYSGTGSYSNDVPLGTYTISFGPVMSFTTPPPQTVSITTVGQTVTISGVYEEIYTHGTLTVTTSGTSGDIYVDNIFRGNSFWSDNVSVGTHYISFGDVQGFTTPSDQSVYVDGGQTVSVIGFYSLEQMPGGVINVSTNLSQATFTINGPENYSGSGTSWSMQSAPSGDYTIVFYDVSGFTTPPSQTLFLSDASSISFTGSYSELPSGTISSLDISTDKQSYNSFPPETITATVTISCTGFSPYEGIVYLDYQGSQFEKPISVGPNSSSSVTFSFPVLPSLSTESQDICASSGGMTNCTSITVNEMRVDLQLVVRDSFDGSIINNATVTLSGVNRTGGAITFTNIRGGEHPLLAIAEGYKPLSGHIFISETGNISFTKSSQYTQDSRQLGVEFTLLPPSIGDADDSKGSCLGSSFLLLLLLLGLLKSRGDFR